MGRTQYLEKIVIPSAYKGKAVTQILPDAFNGAKNLTEITIPDSVTSIGSSAFKGCSSLTSVTIGNGVTSIGESAFSACYSLTSVTIGNGVTSIGESAFSVCSSLTSVTIPNSVTSIGDRAFSVCRKLVEVINKSSLTITKGMYSYGDVAHYALEVHDGESKIKTQGDYQFYTVGGVNYLVNYIGNDTELTLPANYNEENYVINDYVFYNNDKITKVTIPDSVTSIGDMAFYDCNSLTSVYYDGDIVSWCNISFGYDANPVNYAKKLYIKNSGTNEYELLTNLVIPDSVTEIKNYAFEGCDSLTSVTIGNSVTSIGSSAFENCDSLTSITIPFVGATKDGTENTHFGYIFGASSGVNNKSYVPNSLKTVVITGGTRIGGVAFYYCDSLTSVTIGNGVTSIGSSAFKYCSSLTSVTIPNSVTSIGEDAFEYCTSLTSVYYDGDIASWCNISFGSYDANPVYYAKKLYIKKSGTNEYELLTSLVIPDSVTEIKNYAFHYCDSLTSVTIPNSVTSIGEDAFEYCTNLMSVYYDGDIASWCNISFGCDANPVNYAKKIYIKKSGTNEYELLTNLVIPDSVTEIKNYAFEGCDSLTSVTIGNSVTSIGSSAFENCDSLTSITIPFVGATKDGTENTHFGYIFGASSGVNNKSYVPNSLKTVVITGGTRIGGVAFYYCDSLTSVTIGNGVTNIGSSAFEGCKIAKATIPASAISAIPKSNLKEVVITSGIIGSSAFDNCSSLTSVTIGSGVESIGSSAFDNCSSLTSVTIGSGVESIGSSAFSSCDSLTSVYYDGDIASWCNISFGSSSANPVYYAKKLYIKKLGTNEYELLTNLVIPDSVTEIKDDAFHNCDSLTSVTIGNSVTSIGSSAFWRCTGLTSVTIGNGVTSIGSGAFSGCVSLVEVINKSSLTLTKGSASNGYVAYHALEIHNGESKIVNKNGYLFYTYDSVNYLVKYAGSDTQLTLPANYNGENYVINDYAFYYNNKITKVTIPDSVTSIGSYAFYSCDSLTSVTIPNSVTSIGEQAFAYCGILTSVTIGNGVTSIGDAAFRGCSGLTSITVDESNTAYKSIDGNLYSKDGKALIQYAIGKTDTSFVIPDGVTSIDHYAFEDCTNLTSVTIPNSVTSIGDKAFYDCDSLTSVTIGNGVTSIGGSAFYNTAYYKNESNWENGGLYIGKYLIDAKIDMSGTYTVKEGTKLIADSAFFVCSLTSVTIPNSVTSIGEDAFSSCDSLTSVTIGNNVTSIGSYAFSGCNNLTSIKCRGTEEEWKDISKGNNWNSGVPSSCVITYNYTGE